MRSGQHVRRTDEDSSSERVASLGLRLDSADPAKWDLGCVGDRTHGGADRRLSDAPCSGPWGRLPEVGPGSPAAGCAERVRAPAGGAAGFPWLRRRRRTGFFLRHVPLPELCTLSTARGARTTWATSEIAQRTAFFRDGNVCHRRTSSPIAHRSGRRDPFINCWICAWTAWLNSTALLTLPMPMAPVPAIPVLVAPLWIATSLGEPLSSTHIGPPLIEPEESASCSMSSEN